MTDEVLQTVIELVAEQALLDPTSLDPDAPLSEMGLDSLALVEGLYAVEEYFDIHVPFNANTDLNADTGQRTARNIAAEVRALVAAKSA